jgi:hypothetical protein
MGVEFRLGGQDHNKVEDFLAHHPSGVHAIVLDTKAAKHQQAAAEAAVDAGVARRPTGSSRHSKIWPRS